MKKIVLGSIGIIPKYWGDVGAAGTTPQTPTTSPVICWLLLLGDAFSRERKLPYFEYFL